MEIKMTRICELTNEQLNQVSGCGFFYELGKLLAESANANDAIHAQYGNTNQNHWIR